MKSAMLFLISSVFLLSCVKRQPADDRLKSKIALLKVDYQTCTFEGGAELEFPQSESFTITSSYLAPGDFGSIQLYYDEFNEKIFDGSIIWAGKGAISYPASFNPSGSFSAVSNPLPLPADEFFSPVIYDEFEHYPNTINYPEIWKSINNLEIVSSYRQSNPDGKINVFLYTPSVGVGNPADWDRFIILKN